MKSNWLTLAFASVAVSLQGCGNAKMELSKDLIVVEQTDSVFGSQIFSYLSPEAQELVGQKVDGKRIEYSYENDIF